MDQRTLLLRHRFLITLTGALIGVLLVAIVNNLLVGARAAAGGEALFALVLLIGWVAYLRGRARHLLPILILLVDMTIIHWLYFVLRGNSLAGAYSLLVMFPLISAYFLPARRSIIWSAIFAFSLVIHVLLSHSGLISSGLTGPNLIRILIVYGLAAYITLGDRWITEVFTKSVEHEAQTQTEAAANLRLEVEAIKSAERARSLFVSLASHQLRGPLTAMRWSLEAFSHEAQHLTSTEKQSLQSAQASTMRMIHLVTELLNVSRIESGRLRVVPVATNIIQLAENALSDLQPLADAKQIILVSHLPAKAVKMNLDPVLISQVMINFVSNAIKYSAVKQRVEFTMIVNRGQVRCEVADHGIGIPAADQPKVFQQMFRAGNAQRVDESGTGLGLFLAQAIIRLSGGEIGFTSREKVGSTFWFTLPLSGSEARAGEISYEKTVPV